MADRSSQTPDQKEGQTIDPLNQERRCISFSEALENKRLERAKKTGPEPWVVRKLTVGVTLGVLVFELYAYTARLCVPMLRREGNARGSRPLGAALLAVFATLWLITMWAYCRVVLTPPGYARDHVEKSQKPPDTPAGHTRHWDIDTELGSPYDSMAANELVNLPDSSAPERPSSSTGRATHENDDTSIPIEEPNGVKLGTVSALKMPRDIIVAKAAELHQVAPFLEPTPTPQRAPRPSRDGTRLSNHAKTDRRPSTHPVLSPEFRYCPRDNIVKPLRTHHCRICGTCVLMYDHHCPWIGQCVGARNYKFFYNTLQWGLIFSTFVTVTLIYFMASRTDASIDGQMIAAVVLSAWFTLFTSILLMQHTNLTLMNATTVEQIGMMRMKERERDLLADTFPWTQMRARRDMRKQWNKDWGRIGAEGNLWWAGSRKANWQARMGKNPWGWILPIGRDRDVGLSYPTNPRFDSLGRWQPRREWPAELR